MGESIPAVAESGPHGPGIEKPSSASGIEAPSVRRLSQFSSTNILKRDISPLNMVAVAFNISNSWTAVATTLAIAIAAGGTFTLVYGVIVVSVAYLAVAVTLAELASVYPTAGGQYHFTYAVALKKWSRGLSYICGVAVTCSWVFLIAAVTTLGSQILLALPEFYVDGYQPVDWHYFLVFQAIQIAMLIYNIFALKRAPWVHEIGFVLSLSTFLSVTIVCLARSTKQSSSFVWDNFENNTGWSSGITFLTGLVTPASMFIGLDGALHLADECLDPRRSVPHALMTTVGIGFATAFGFVVAMCYGIIDLDALLDTGMPIFELWRQAIKNDTAATIFLVALLCVVLFAVNAMVHTASRMTLAFAQDKGLYASGYLSIVDKRLEVPIWALIANAVVVLILGCIYLGSSVAFNAIIGCSIILQMVSFAIPSFLLILRQRSSEVLPNNRYFKVPALLGWLANIVVVGFAIIETIFFILPPQLPVTGSNMNYAAVVLAVIALIAILNWHLYAKKHYTGPNVMVEEGAGGSVGQRGV